MAGKIRVNLKSGTSAADMATRVGARLRGRIPYRLPDLIVGLLSLSTSHQFFRRGAETNEQHGKLK